MAAVVAASRSLAKCWLRPAARAVSRVFTLLGSSESHPLLSPSLLSPQAARLSRKPPASGMARRSPERGPGAADMGRCVYCRCRSSAPGPVPPRAGHPLARVPAVTLAGEPALGRGMRPRAGAGAPRRALPGLGSLSAVLYSGARPWVLGGCSGCQNLASPTCYSWLGAYGRGSG